MSRLTNSIGNKLSRKQSPAEQLVTPVDYSEDENVKNTDTQNTVENNAEDTAKNEILEAQNQMAPAVENPPVVEPNVDTEVKPEKRKVGRPKQMDVKVTTIYFDRQLDWEVHRYLLERELNSNGKEKMSKSEWIRDLVEAELRRLGRIQ